jgi:hypothetical protein
VSGGAAAPALVVTRDPIAVVVPSTPRRHREVIGEPKSPGIQGKRGEKIGWLQGGHRRVSTIRGPAPGAGTRDAKESTRPCTNLDQGPTVTTYSPPARRGTDGGGGRASSPCAASPTTETSGRASRTPRSPRRTSGWSSAGITERPTVILFGAGRRGLPRCANPVLPLGLAALPSVPGRLPVDAVVRGADVGPRSRVDADGVHVPYRVPWMTWPMRRSRRTAAGCASTPSISFRATGLPVALITACWASCLA